MKDRPRTVIWCERLAVVALLLRLGTAYWGDGPARIAMADSVAVPGVGLAVLLVGIFAPTALVFWATRRANRVAAWIFAVWIALLGVGFGAAIALGQIRFGLISSISLIILSLHIVSVLLLFTRSTRRWVRGERTADEIAAEFS